MGLVQKVYALTDEFPKTETYGLISQIRKAAVSVPSNIAEGFRRQYPKEYRQFLSVSLGSCGELETQLEIARRLRFLDDRSCEEIVGDINKLCRMIHALVKKIAPNRNHP